MNNCLTTLIFTMCVFGKAHSQNFYFKPYIRYHQSVIKQQSPQYFTLILSGPIILDVSSEIKKFSLSNGFKYGGCFGLQLNNILGVETGIEYFKTGKTINADAGIFSLAGTTNWKYNSIQASPAFTFRKINKKSTLTGRAGIIVGMAWLQNSLADGSFAYKTYQMNKSISLGYTSGLEYDYNFKRGFALAIEGGLEHSSYTPKKAKLTAIYGVSGNGVQDQKEVVKEINYVTQLRDVPISFDIYTNISTSDQNKPEIRIKDAIKLSSVYFGIGIKYDFLKDEKK